jgi:hypothetical protein
MEVNKMSKEKKVLVRKFKAVVEDLMDNYEEYNEEEKAQIKEIFQKVADLNKVLDKYDVDMKIDWDEYLLAVGNYFDAMRY